MGRNGLVNASRYGSITIFFLGAESKAEVALIVAFDFSSSLFVSASDLLRAAFNRFINCCGLTRSIHNSNKRSKCSKLK